MRILLSIPSLMPGGAERQFAELAAGLSERGHEVLAATLGQAGPLEAALGKAELVTLNKQGRWDNLRVALRLAGLLRSFRPQVHYAFLSTPCVLGALVRPAAPAARLVMGMRATNVDPGAYAHGRAGSWLQSMEVRLSFLADLVIVNSHAGLRDCLARGFPETRAVVVPNGIDTARCRPDRALGAALRQGWGIGPGEALIGLVARLDPMKDHPNFLRAAALLAARRPEARFVCVGGGPESYLAELRDQAAGLGLAKRLVWAGMRTDMPEVYNALDALCLSSAFGEGFPNVLGEAMACGVPCCATDAGDAALVLGDTGRLVPKGEPEALAAGLEDLLERLKREDEGLGRACRERIVVNFGVQRMVDDTEALLAGLCGKVQP
ncbi:MAG: group 1 glycosyl transferase [Deltaproteobacteria bacterium HGW-Deltaproteobacteria-8]|jgi:glycosyltransferase involved in cell wall biosynthesis|nr:MAG: group 1 glycosyl transferase [Deltaproteobacteria bacterium HGW-Deltaproteobacteria-8]